LRPTFGSSRRTVLTTSSPPVRAGVGVCACAVAWLDRLPANAGTGVAPGLFIVIDDAADRRGAVRGARTATVRAAPNTAVEVATLDPKFSVSTYLHAPYRHPGMLDRLREDFRRARLPD